MALDFLLYNLEKARLLSQAIVEGINLDELIEKSEGHTKKTLLFLRDHKEAKALLKRFKLPVANRYIETLIRASINLPPKTKLTNAHLQQAVISALLCPLRQVVGSCFATAPAIYIQNEQKERLLIDLYDLMMLCQLKRTFAGKENIVPISPSWGGRETDHPLLRVWEYTLASFSDYKVEFSRWNFYKSLGLDPQEQGGLGFLLYKTLQEKLDDANKEMEKLQQDYFRAIDEARVSQALLRQADSVDRMRMRKAELEVRAHHAESCKDLRDAAHERAQNLSTFFAFLIEKYTEKFQEYFLEIYDADLVEVDPELYEDSPAGFRLVYKHGRSDPLAWTLIHSAQEYIQSLSQFFSAVEPMLIAECEWEGGRKEIQTLTTLVLHYLQTEDFLNFATREKKPWSYISGGNMHKLLQCYYCVDGELAEEKRIIEDAQDLLIFLLDLMKSLPYLITKRFEEDLSCSLFMYSPIHAFLFKPGSRPFIEGWLDKGFSYTWVRDQVILPGLRAYEEVRLDRNAQAQLGMELLGPDFYPHGETLNLPDFRKLLYERAPEQQEKIDSFLFHAFPRPDPLIFADTNWLNYAFAFAVNPATLELDLYRYDPLTKRGVPMTIWNSWNAVWGVLTRPGDISGSYLPDLALKLRKV